LPCLHSLLGHAAGNYVREDALLVEVLDLGAEAAVEHLGHVRSEALKELGGAVPVITEPLLVLFVLVAKVVVLLLVDGLATEGEVGPPASSRVLPRGACHELVLLVLLELLEEDGSRFCAS
jgi:hypothetical protein